MELRPLELRVISAKDIKDVNLFTKMDVYVVVSINGDHRTAQKTPVHKESGSNPNWNCTMKFTIDETAAHQNHHNLVFRLKSNRVFGDKEIGSVQVPIRELLDQENGNGNVDHQHVSFSVMLANGKTKGVFNFAYRFGEKFSMPALPPPPFPGAGSYKHGGKPVMAYPPPPTGYPGPSSGHLKGTYPPPPQGMTGYQPPQGGYGYPQVQQPQKSKKGGMGAGLGLGLAGGLLGGMLIGDMVDDAYEAGVEDGLDYDY
ncbi:hypothetical protein GOBAR_DD12981 [Gossypium barbadense]|nr:hypothetical protein GOBAR_DD12981 [Gossypium barbadense]